jgi:Ca2+-binding RTX toxin-like protein
MEVQGSAIGNWILSTRLDRYDEDFYAQVYSYGGQIVIAYRGTDGWWDTPDWATGAGDYWTEQTRLAAQFYRSVATEHPSFQITLTGHSLGGGLAGFVGSIYGVDGVLFDNMPYEFAAQRLYDNARTIYDPDLEGGGAIDPAARQEFYGSAEPWVIDGSGLTGYAVQGEALGYLRALQSMAPTELESPYGGPVDRHAQSLLVILLYAGQMDDMNSKWTNLGASLIENLFSTAVAEAAGANTIQGTSSADEKMRSMIAYSAIDEGTRPFGDSAIRALFDDANQVGELFEDENVSQTLQNTASLLSGIIVQYAGQLAKWQDTSEIGKDGILSVEQNLLVADFSSARWNLSSEGSATIAAKPMLLYQLVGTALGSAGVSDPSHLLLDMWGSNASDQFDLVAFAATKDAFSGVVPQGSGGWGGPQSDKITLILTDEGDDSIQGLQGNELIVGMDGDDVLIGGGGADLLIGGDGDDLLIGKDASYLLGGAGSDHLKAESGAVTLDGGAGNDYLEAIGDGPVTYVFGKGSGHDVLGSLFPAAQSVDENGLPQWDPGWNNWAGQRQHDTILLKDLSPSDLILQWDYEENIYVDSEEGYTWTDIFRWGPAAIKILPTGDTLYLGNLSFYQLIWPMEWEGFGFIHEAILALGNFNSQLGWSFFEGPGGTIPNIIDYHAPEYGYYDLNLFETADGTRYDIMSLFDFKDLTNIVQATLPAEYYTA